MGRRIKDVIGWSANTGGPEVLVVLPRLMSAQGDKQATRMELGLCHAGQQKFKNMSLKILERV